MKKGIGHKNCSGLSRLWNAVALLLRVKLGWDSVDWNECEKYRKWHVHFSRIRGIMLSKVFWQHVWCHQKSEMCLALFNEKFKLWSKYVFFFFFLQTVSLVSITAMKLWSKWNNRKWAGAKIYKKFIYMIVAVVWYLYW